MEEGWFAPALGALLWFSMWIPRLAEMPVSPSPLSWIGIAIHLYLSMFLACLVMHGRECKTPYHCLSPVGDLILPLFPRLYKLASRPLRRLCQFAVFVFGHIRDRPVNRRQRRQRQREVRRRSRSRASSSPSGRRGSVQPARPPTPPLLPAVAATDAITSEEVTWTPPVSAPLPPVKWLRLDHPLRQPWTSADLEVSGNSEVPRLAKSPRKIAPFGTLPSPDAQPMSHAGTLESSIGAPTSISVNTTNLPDALSMSHADTLDFKSAPMALAGDDLANSAGQVEGSALVEVMTKEEVEDTTVEKLDTTPAEDLIGQQYAPSTSEVQEPDPVTSIPTVLSAPAPVIRELSPQIPEALIPATTPVTSDISPLPHSVEDMDAFPTEDENTLSSTSSTFDDPIPAVFDVSQSTPLVQEAPVDSAIASPAPMFQKLEENAPIIPYMLHQANPALDRPVMLDSDQDTLLETSVVEEFESGVATEASQIDSPIETAEVPAEVPAMVIISPPVTHPDDSTAREVPTPVFQHVQLLPQPTGTEYQHTPMLRPSGDEHQQQFAEQIAVDQPETSPADDVLANLMTGLSMSDSVQGDKHQTSVLEQEPQHSSDFTQTNLQPVSTTFDHAHTQLPLHSVDELPLSSSSHQEIATYADVDMEYESQPSSFAAQAESFSWTVSDAEYHQVMNYISAVQDNQTGPRSTPSATQADGDVEMTGNEVHGSNLHSAGVASSGTSPVAGDSAAQAVTQQGNSDWDFYKEGEVMQSDPAHVGSQQSDLAHVDPQPFDIAQFDREFIANNEVNDGVFLGSFQVHASVPTLADPTHNNQDFQFDFQSSGNLAQDAFIAADPEDNRSGNLNDHPVVQDDVDTEVVDNLAWLQELGEQFDMNEQQQLEQQQVSVLNAQSDPSSLQRPSFVTDQGLSRSDIATLQEPSSDITQNQLFSIGDDASAHEQTNHSTVQAQASSSVNDAATESWSHNLLQSEEPPFADDDSMAMDSSEDTSQIQVSSSGHGVSIPQQTSQDASHNQLSSSDGNATLTQQPSRIMDQIQLSSSDSFASTLRQTSQAISQNQTSTSESGMTTSQQISEDTPQTQTSSSEGNTTAKKPWVPTISFNDAPPVPTSDNGLSTLFMSAEQRDELRRADSRAKLRAKILAENAERAAKRAAEEAAYEAAAAEVEREERKELHDIMSGSNTGQPQPAPTTAATVTAPTELAARPIKAMKRRLSLSQNVVRCPEPAAWTPTPIPTVAMPFGAGPRDTSAAFTYAASAAQPAVTVASGASSTSAPASTSQPAVVVCNDSNDLPASQQVLDRSEEAASINSQPLDLDMPGLEA